MDDIAVFQIIADFADCQIALAFVGAMLYVAVERSHSMFNASIRRPLEEQRRQILDDADLIRRAEEMLIQETGILQQIG